MVGAQIAFPGQQDKLVEFYRRRNYGPDRVAKNILRAVEWANRNGLVTFGCTGFGGGRLRQIAQKGLHVPLDDMGIVESIHLTAFHWVVDDMHRRVSLS